MWFAVAVWQSLIMNCYFHFIWLYCSFDGFSCLLMMEWNDLPWAVRFLSNMACEHCKWFTCSNQFLVCPMKHAAVLMTLEATHKTVPLEDEVIHSFVACTVVYIADSHMWCVVLYIVTSLWHCSVCRHMKWYRGGHVCTDDDETSVLYTVSQKKSDQRYYSFTTLPNVSRF